MYTATRRKPMDNDLGNAEDEVLDANGDAGEAGGEVLETQSKVDLTGGEMLEMQGDLGEACGEVFETLGEVDLASGEMHETQGDLGEACGEVLETLGEVNLASGDILETQGAVSHQWARGESAILQLKAVEVITKHMLANPKSIQEQGTYTSLFFQKDLRRGYSFVIEMYLGIVCNEFNFFGRGSESEQGWLLQYMPEFRDGLQARGVRLETLPKELELMLELALPLNAKNKPYLPEDMPDWFAPKCFKSTFSKPQDKVGQLFETLPKPIADILTSMPKGAAGEDMRVRFMHAAIHYRGFARRYHKSQAKVEERAAEKEKAQTTDEEVKQIARDNHNWVKATEQAFRTHLPDMAAMFEQAEDIEKDAEELKKKANAK